MLAAIAAKLALLPRSLCETFWSACLSAFFTLLRSANSFKTDSNPNSYLRVQDVDLLLDRANFRVRVLKTNSFLGKPITLWVPRLSATNLLCPVAALDSMLRANKIKPKQTLSSYHDQGHIVPLSGRLFNSLLHQVIAAAVVEIECLSAHSFRRGGATLSASMGVDPLVIKAHGNWRSDCYMRYIERDNQLRKDIC